jgi:hypothetical protein
MHLVLICSDLVRFARNSLYAMRSWIRNGFGAAMASRMLCLLELSLFTQLR